jgi:alanyl-tRNA synthetase
VTSRIYYTDPYCRRFEAVVTRAFDHEGRPAALLDRTAFYPTSGGQPFDIGRLLPAGEEQRGPGEEQLGPGEEQRGSGEERRGLITDRSAIDVIDTIDADDEVLHILSAPIAVGAAVSGEIDWTRRFDHMQQHTGQHVLSAAFDRLFENPTASFHMGTETSTIDLARDMSWEQIARGEAEANRIIWENREVAIRFVSSDLLRDGFKDPSLQLRKQSKRTGTVRLIEVKDFDLSACGGTHVARTGAIGAVVVPAAEKFKGGARITFACGVRAIRVFRTLRDAVSGSVRALSVLPHDLPGAIERMQAETKELRRTIKNFQESLAAQEAARLAAPVVVEALEGWDAHGLKMIATEITARTGAAVALFSTSPPITVVVARSPDVALDANAVVRVVIERFGGRGGGRPDLAQGGGLTGDLRAMISFVRERLSIP